MIDVHLISINKVCSDDVSYECVHTEVSTKDF